LIELSFCQSFQSLSEYIIEYSLKFFRQILLGVILLGKSYLHEPLACIYYLQSQIQACPFNHRHDDDDDDGDTNNNNNKFLSY